MLQINALAAVVEFERLIIVERVYADTAAGHGSGV